LARTLALMALSVCVCACVKLDRPSLDKRYFDLEISRPGPAAQADNDTVLALRRLRVSPRYQGRELVYKTGDNEFSSDFYNLFFVPPADMLGQDLREWLEAAGLFGHVVDTASLAPADLVLEAAVNRLYADLSATPARAVAEMQFIMLRDVSGKDEIVFSAAYEAALPVERDSPQGLVRAMREAVAEVFARLEADLRAAGPGRP
ncbi:MAG: ABC-type transport auxiliary lipoprotein family protein, partial [Desulfovibrionaceae bacterium]|nr:ABC-type transport auxiliary lipoprotein family protein [Desulfovibrionaceae bacterium]